MKIFVLITTHLVSVAIGIGIYHWFFMNYVKNRIDNLVFDEILEIVDEKKGAIK